MIKQVKLALVAATTGVILTTATVHAATYNGDLLIGFSKMTGNDLIYDLGSASSLTNGQTWNLASLLSGYTLSTVKWGVIGGLQTVANNNSRFVWCTTDGNTTPNNINGLASFTAFTTSLKSIYQNFGTAGAGQSLLIAATDDNSWNSQTISPIFTTQWLNVAGGVSPNVTGLTSDTFYQVVANNTNPSVLGNFTLAANGVVTYHTASLSPVANFTGNPTQGFASLTVIYADASTGTITNWVWSFGDGRSITNTTSSNVTNTYAVAGTYTVSLTVTGTGGANTKIQSSYIVASPTPAIGGVTLSGGKLVFGGTNCPASVQYRILTSTNVALSIANWTPVATNAFLPNGTFSYTNVTSGTASFFRLVSP